MLISPKQNNTSAQTLYQKICPRRFIQYTKLYANTLLRYVQRERVEVQCQLSTIEMGT